VLDMDAKQEVLDLSNRTSQLAGSRQQLMSQQTILQQQKQALQKYIDLSGQVSATLDNLTSDLLGNLSETIEEKLTLALQQVLELPIQLKIQRDVKRGRMTLDFFIQQKGKAEDIMRGQGGSVANILSVGLRLFALTTLDAEKHRRFLVLDEQDCWLRPDLVPRLVQLVHEAGKALGFQILMISHHNEESFMNYADRIFRLESGENGVQVSLCDAETRQPDANII